MAAPGCKPFCRGVPAERACIRIDCAACLQCANVSATAINGLVRTAQRLWVNCSSDGSFRVPEDVWPAPYHMLDRGLALSIARVVGSASLLDIGAGSGQYGAYFHELRRSGRADVPAWRGVDGAANIESFTLRRGPPGARVRHANICDAARARAPAERADWVMSLEVGEHLPSSCLGTYRELLHRSNRRGILLSWARPGQGGRCHVSLREPAWVVSSFESLGYAVDHPATEQARSAADLKWMQHNFLVLRRAPPVKGLRPS